MANEKLLGPYCVIGMAIFAVGAILECLPLMFIGGGIFLLAMLILATKGL